MWAIVWQNCFGFFENLLTITKCKRKGLLIDSLNLMYLFEQY